MLIIPLFHCIGDGFADFFVAVILPPLSISRHFPHDEYVLDISDESCNLHLHGVSLLNPRDSPHHNICDWLCDFFLGLKQQVQYMLRAQYMCGIQ